jgi:hypothetical protein
MVQGTTTHNDIRSYKYDFDNIGRVTKKISVFTIYKVDSLMFSY